MTVYQYLFHAFDCLSFFHVCFFDAGEQRARIFFNSLIHRRLFDLILFLIIPETRRVLPGFRPIGLQPKCQTLVGYSYLTPFCIVGGIHFTGNAVCVSVSILYVSFLRVEINIFDGAVCITYNSCTSANKLLYYSHTRWFLISVNFS